MYKKYIYILNKQEIIQNYQMLSLTPVNIYTKVNTIEISKVYFNIILFVLFYYYRWDFYITYEKMRV